jgi:hypothetical protein
MLEDAFVHHRAKDYDAAEDIYQHLLGYMDQPDANVLACYGMLWAQRGNYGLASHLLRQAVTVYPEHPGAWVNLAISLRHLGRKEAALYCAQQGVKYSNDEHAWNALAGLYLNTGEPEKGEEFARKAVECNPQHAEAQNNLALALLEQGKFDEAWPHYEYRWLVEDKIDTQRPWKAPKWDGKPIGYLVVQGEQGIGDEILFMGCFAEARKRARYVAVECTERLVDWFSASFGVPCYPNHAALVAAEGEPEAFITMGSLPALMGMPDGRPYLKRYRKAVPKRIGLAWRGGAARTNKRERTIKPEMLRPILDIPGYEFTSVQYDGADDAKLIGIRDEVRGREIESIRDEIASCELVVSVCQTAVHMAGAIGVPALVMTPRQCAWRYCGHPTRMIWYKNVELFRQRDDERWEPVIDRIAQRLAAMPAIQAAE